MSLINKFNVFSEIDQQLVKNIKLFYLTKYELLFVTTDNSVFKYVLKNKQIKKLESFCDNHVIIKLECSNNYLTEPHYKALTDNGRVYSWGNNSNGQLGTGTTISCEQPKLINSLSDEFITDISCGAWHSLVLTRDGKVYSFGYNRSGQCGNDNTIDQLVPILVDVTKVVKISSGEEFSIAFIDTGDVYGWGRKFLESIGR